MWYSSVTVTPAAQAKYLEANPSKRPANASTSTSSVQPGKSTGEGTSKVLGKRDANSNPVNEKVETVKGKKVKVVDIL